ncbi:flagellar motor switch phosphatase FliY [Thalassobacillus hwangdonensis]|uniref:Flagellar motor switch phosphatase FliY n=1 Tax=Thalassobacillus hwangdonensis TaxID=546108 RepID=A0ABW3KYI3_9BACI
MMSDDMLSQDEIDALLRGDVPSDDVSQESETVPANDAAETHADFQELSPLQQDALGEIGNISFGSSATALSSLLNQKVEITTPKVSVISRKNLPDEFPRPHVAIQVKYTEGFMGENLLVIQSRDAAIIADLMLGGDGTSPDEEMNDIHLSAVQEAMNQMMGSAATSMSTVFNKRVDISPPAIDVLDVAGGEGTESIPNNDHLVKISFNLKVGTLIDSNIMQLLPFPFAIDLVDELLNPPEQDDLETVNEKEPEPVKAQPVQQTPVKEQPTAPTPQASVQQSAEPQMIGRSQFDTEETPVETAQFSDFEQVQLGSNEQRNLDMLLDIPLKVTVELGRTKRTIKEILELSKGSVLELDKLAGEPVDIHVNSKLIAKGEVVVIDENFGVRVTDILSPKDRLKKIR